jgi:ribosomal protein L23
MVNTVYDTQFTESPVVNINSSPWNLIEAETPEPLYAPKASQTSGTFAGESRFDVMSDRRAYTDAEFINTQRAEQQPEWLKGVNAVAGGVISGLATAVQDVSYIADIENGIARLTGAQEIEENWLGQAMKDFKQGLGEEMPIYKDDPNAVWDWGDSGSYWSALKGVIDSAVGFGIPGMAAGKLVGLALKAARTSVLLSKMTNSAANAATALGAGFLTNYAEGKTMGIEMFDNAMQNAKSNYYDQILGKHMSQVGELGLYKTPQQAADAANLEYEVGLANGKEEEFRKIAGAEADKFQRNNMVFMLTDAMALGGLFKPLKGSTRNLINKETLKNYFLGANLDNFAVQGVKEGAEEIGQNVMQSEAEYQAAEKSGVDTRESPELFDRVLKFATSDKALLEGAMGFFGGPVQRVLVKGMSGQYGSKYKQSIEEQIKAQANQFQVNKEFLSTKFNQYQSTTELAKAAEGLGQEGIKKALKDNLFATKAADNFMAGTTEAFEADLNEIASMTPEQAQAKGYDEDYASKANSMKRELKELEKEWIKTSKYQNPGAVFMNRQDRKLASITYKTANQEAMKAKAAVLDNIAPYRSDITDTSNDAFENGKFSDNKAINDRIVKSPEYKKYVQLQENLEVASETVKQIDDAYDVLTSDETQRKIIEAAKVGKQLLAQAEEEQKKKANQVKAETKRKVDANKINPKPVKVNPEAEESTEVKPEKPIDTADDEVVDELGADEVKPVETVLDKGVEANTVKSEMFTKVEPLMAEEDKAAKIADIEARREQEHDAYREEWNQRALSALEDGVDITIPESFEEEQDWEQNGTPTQIATDKINAKYDAELAALEAQPTKTDKVAAEIETVIEDVTYDTEYTDDKDKSVNKEQVSVDKVVAEENANITGVSEEGAPEYDYWRIVNGANAVAYLSRKFQQLYNFTRNSFTRQDVDNSLHEGMLDKSVLSNKKFKKGTKLTIKVDNDDTIVTYAPGSTTKETITWGEYVALQGEGFIGSQEYNDKIPMAIYDETGKKVLYLHEVGWITEENISGDIEQNKKNLQAIRQAVLDNSNTLDVEVESKTAGMLFRTSDNSKLLLSEAMPDKSLVIAIAKKSVLYLGRGEGSVSTYDIANKELQDGVTYAVVPMGDRYIAIPVNNLKLDRKQDIVATILKAIRVYATNDVKSQIRTEILKETKLDITTPAGIDKFLQMYINNFNITGTTIEGKTDKRVINIQNGKIRFGKGGEETEKLSYIAQSTPAANLEKLLSTLEKHLNGMYSNISLDHISNAKSKVVFIAEDNSITTQSYYDYIKSITESNVISANIGTNEAPEYTYFIQPVIRLAVDNIINKEEVKKEAEVIPEVKVEEVEKVETKEKPKYKSKKINKDTGDDLPMSDKQVDALAESAKQIYVADLGAIKQNQIISFLRGRLISALFTSTTPQKTSDVITSLYEEYADLLRDARTDIEAATEAGELEDAADFQELADEISKVMDNWDTLSRIAKEQVAKINGVTIDITEDGDDSFEESLDGKNEESFDADKALTMDGISKLSTKVKMLLGNIKQIDKNGEVVTNYLNQEVTVPFDEVYNALQSITADLDPDLNVMIAKMEQFRDKNKWIGQVITLLKEASSDVQNGFVTGMTNHTHHMKFIMWSRDNKGKFTLTEYDANSNSLMEVTKNEWRNNMLFTSAIAKNDLSTGTMVGNKEVIDLHIAIMDEWIKTKLPDASQVAVWLNTIGIEMTPDAINKIVNDKVKGMVYQQQFKTGGIFKIIRDNLDKLSNNDISSSSFFTDSAIKELAKVQVQFKSTFSSNSFRAGTKTIFSYGNNKLLINQLRRAKMLNKTKNGKFTNTMLTELAKTSFTAESLWLKDILLTNEQGAFIEAENGEYEVNVKSPLLQNLNHAVVSLEAIKEMGSKSKDNRELHKLSPMEIEVFKLGMLQASRADLSGNNKRIIGVTYPTTSDKTTVMMLQVVAFDAKYNADATVDDDTLNSLYEIFALPELKRISAFQKLAIKDQPNNEAYSDSPSGTNKRTTKRNGGANKFIMFPEFNNIEGLFNDEGEISADAYSAEFKEKFKVVITRYISELTEEKLAMWEKLGIGETKKDSKGKVVAENAFIDNKFLVSMQSKATGFAKENSIRFAATDMVVQYLVSNAESFKMFIGDPAQFWKPKRNSKTITAQVKDAFENIGKRLAADIAPGTELADSLKDDYIQIFLQDHKAASKELDKRLKEILTKDELKAYGGEKRFESTDAQEYTTWQEHLKVLRLQGRITQAQEELFASKIKSGQKLSYDELGTVLQPIKPVYAENMNTGGDLRRRVYIKSSSFPLLPQLTAGLQLEKLRVAMEELEKNQGKTVRAAYNTAVKVGGLQNAAQIWDKEGNIVEGLSFLPIKDILPSWFILNRSGFRIQQDVPHDPTKSSIREVTQASKNLFVNMLNFDGFKVPWNDKNYTGKELKQEFNNLHGELYKIGLQELKDNLLVEETDVVDIEKLRELVKSEAIRRNYNISDRLLIELDRDLSFLPFSSVANKYQAVLNALVYDRVLKQKIHGKSYVLGSAQGFKTDTKLQSTIEGIEGVVFTDNWTGDIMPTSKNADGSIKFAQVLLPWKFKDNEGNKLHIEDFTKVIDGKTTIDFDKLPKELLEGFGMRIPNQGPNSQVAFEIVGFVPELSGDLIIAPEDLVVQMGSDFDVDKLYTYTYNTFYNEGKLTKVTEDTKKLIKGLEKANKETIIKLLFADDDYISELEDEASLLRKVYKKLDKQILQNKIVDIHISIHKNTNKEIQASIARPLGTWLIEDTAKDVEEAKARRGDAVLFTGLSEAYQTKKFIQATAGKDGVSVFSLDSAFNAIAQGTGIKFVGTKEVPFHIAFGGVKSNGTLDGEKTLDGKYYISDVIAGYQSGAVDNEKLQVLDKLNINSETFGVIKLLNQLGFGEETLYFISQDIIFDYVEELQRLKGIMGEFVPNAAELAYENVLNNPKYSAKFEEGEEIKFSEPPLKQMRDMVLYEDTVPADFAKYQVALLNKFISLEGYINNLSDLQRGINIDSKGFGKSIIESNLKEEQIMKLFSSPIQNATNLFGDVVIQSNETNVQEYIDKGYIQKIFGTVTYLIKPTTIPGMAVVYGLFTNNNLWNQVFPTNTPVVRGAVQEMEVLLGREDKSFQNKSDLRFAIWNSLKSYIYTSAGQIFNGSVNERRDSLTKDVYVTEKIVNDDKSITYKKVSTHKSLATIVTEVKNLPIFRNNSFLQRLSFRKDNDNPNAPSLLEYNASAKEGVDETKLYVDFLDLFLNVKSLGIVNGVEYTTRDLAQELVEYSYVTGGIQEATQFLKMIPPMYLKEMGFMDDVANFDFNDTDTIGLIHSETSLPHETVSTWGMQFIQHNPNLIKEKISDDSQITDAKKVDNEIVSFSLSTNKSALKLFKKYPNFKEAIPPVFLTKYEGGKLSLFKFNGEKYERISVLGTFGSSEYSYEATNQTSIFNGKFESTVALKETPIQGTPTLSNPNKQTAFDTLGIVNNTDGKEQLAIMLSNISTEGGFLGTLADVYLSAMESLPNFEVETVSGVKYYGRWNGTKLSINSDAIGKLTSAEIKSRLMHEITHIFTVEVLNTVLDDKGNISESKLNALKDTDVKRAIRSLSAIFNQYKKSLEEFDAVEYAEYQRKLGIYVKTKENESILDADRFTDKELSKYYATFNIKEFVAQAMADETFQKILNNIPSIDISLFQKFKNTIVKLLNAFLGIKVGSLLSETIANTIDLLNIKEEVLPTDEQVREMFGIENKVLPLKMVEFTNHSGGAYGADTYWDIIGREFGIINHNHYREKGNQSVSQKLRNSKVEATILTDEQLEEARTQVEKLLGKKYPNTKEGNLQVRNYFQVANSDAIFAIATLNGDESFNAGSVFGGTNTAVQLGIKLGKPVYVWDVDSEKWYKYTKIDGTNIGDFKVTPTPILTKNFAGIGTRNIENYNTLDKTDNKWKPRKEYLGVEKENAAKQAIRDVYQKTLDSLNSGDNGLMAEELGRSEAIEAVKFYLDKTDKIEGVTEEWFDSNDGNMYHFIIQDNTNKILAGEYKQGGGEWKSMNPKNWEHKRGMLLAGQVFGSARVITKEQANAEPILASNPFEPQLPSKPKANNIFTFADGIEVNTGFVLNEQQREALQLMADFHNDKSKTFFTLQGYAGTGKAQPLTSKVYTPNGYKLMGEIKIGDLVLDENGDSVKVIGVYPQGNKQVCKVTFSDGHSVECCDEHLWKVYSYSDRNCNRVSKYKKRNKIKYSILTTKEIGESIRISQKRSDLNYQIPTLSFPAKFTKKDLEINPYVLGILLGDGGLTTSVVLSTTDTFILEKVRDIVKEQNLYVVKKSKNLKACDYSITSKIHKKGSNPLSIAIRKLNLKCKSEHKFIPLDYLYSSVEDRINLLNGLMDSDGTVDKRGYSITYSTSSPQLANDVSELAQSLGCVTTISNKKTKCLPSYIVNINQNNQFPVFSLPRKQELVKGKTKYRTIRYITSIDYLGEAPQQCIMLDSKSHLYLTDNFTVTHNTSIIKFLVEYIDKKNFYSNVVFSSPTHRANAVLNQSLKGMKVSTLHKIFGLSPEQDLEEFDASSAKFIQQKDPIISKGGTLIIDESSMINNELFTFITNASKDKGIRVIFMGDPAQIKPVGQETLSKAFSEIKDKYELTKVERTGDNPLLAEVTHIRNSNDIEPMTLNTTSNDSGEGVSFTNDPMEIYKIAVDLFKSLEFKTNPLLARIVSGTNANVSETNQIIRKGIFGEKASNEYNEGDVIMGYDNFDMDYRTQEAKIINSGDYIITKSSLTKKAQFAGVTVEYYELTIQDVIDKNKRPVEIRMLSKNNSIDTFNAIGKRYEQLRQHAASLPKGSKEAAQAWTALSSFKSEYGTPVAITNGINSFTGKPNVKMKKTLDYGYAHTIHKSQGGTYKYVIADLRDISKFKDTELQRQLKYVALSRAQKHAYVLTNAALPVQKETPQIETDDETIDELMPLGYPTIEGVNELKKICK